MNETGVLVSYVTQLVHPGGVFEDSAPAASSIALQKGGQLFCAIFLAGLVVAQFASGLAAQASASCLLYAMGRDSVLPKAVFGTAHAQGFGESTFIKPVRPPARWCSSPGERGSG